LNIILINHTISWK